VERVDAEFFAPVAGGALALLAPLAQADGA
jgi:hypothetical protein